MKRRATAIITVGIALLGSAALAQTRMIEGWEVKRKTDPFTDEVRSTMATLAWEVPLGEEGGIFGLFCIDPVTGVTEGFAMALIVDEPVDEGYYDLTCRFDRGAVSRVTGGAHTYRFDQGMVSQEMVNRVRKRVDFLSLFTPIDPRGFLLTPIDLRGFVAEAASATNLAIRVGPVLTYQFNIAGFAEAYEHAGFGGLNGCPGAPTFP